MNIRLCSAREVASWPRRWSYSREVEMSKFSYRDSGVDVEAGDQLVDWLVDSGSKAPSPRQDSIVSGIGGFAAIFRASFSHMKKPCLVSSTDGIGTKILLAAEFKRHRDVAQDLVAMCVNDLVCSGAEPLFFLDYYATGKLQPTEAKNFLEGVRAACHSVNCALIGGETAEMPGVYRPGDFDAAGFSVGVVDEDEILGSHRVREGDVVIGVSSSGFHSNGYSLLRKVFEPEIRVYGEPQELGTDGRVEAKWSEAKKWIDTLLTPTALYVNLVIELHRKGVLHAVAHITGGGMENLPRVLPRGMDLRLIDWAWPETFVEVQDRAKLSREEMLTTLNCGVGLAIVAEPRSVNAIEAAIRAHGFRSIPMGTIQSSGGIAEPKVLY